MCGTAGWHEDFGDLPSVEERYNEQQLIELNAFHDRLDAQADDSDGYNYEYDGVGLCITTPQGSCFMQGEEADKQHDELEACEHWEDVVQLLSAYEHVCE